MPTPAGLPDISARRVMLLMASLVARRRLLHPCWVSVNEQLERVMAILGRLGFRRARVAGAGRCLSL